MGRWDRPCGGSKDALYNQKWINFTGLVLDGCNLIVETYIGCRCWFQRFGGRYFTNEVLSIESDIGEESNEMFGDVNGVVF